MRLPIVLFAEGGGGRPGDTDHPVVSGLDTRAFALWAALSGPASRGSRIVSGRCFAGNAVLAGCSRPDHRHRGHLDRDGRPGDDRGRRPRRVHARGGRADRRAGAPTAWSTCVVADEAEAVAATQAACSATSRARPRRVAGARPGARCATRSPRAAARAYDVAPILETLADEGSVTCRCARVRAASMVTALARIEGRPVGVIANDTGTWPAARSTSRRLRQGRALPAALRRLRPAGRLAGRHARLRMVGPEAEATGARPPRLPPVHRRRAA